MANVNIFQKYVKGQGHMLIIFLPPEMSCHEGHTCQIGKPHLLGLKNYGQCYSFQRVGKNHSHNDLDL